MSHVHTNSNGHCIFGLDELEVLFDVLILQLRHIALNHLQCSRVTRLSSRAEGKKTAARDVTLYYYNRQRFFRLVGLACASQFVFWSWMAYFQLSKLHFADLLNRESRKTQQKILDVSSKPGISWKIVRFLEVRKLVSLFAHIVIIRGANKRPAVLKSKYIFFKSLLVVGF